ncbi:hypothetical protein CEW46_30595, partial [Bacillus cereus]
KKEEFFELNDKFVYYMLNTRLASLVELLVTTYPKFTSYDDILQIARIGLLKAYNTFDETRGYKWATYLSTCISNEVLLHNRKLYTDRKRFNPISLDVPISGVDNGKPSKSTLDDLGYNSYVPIEFEDLEYAEFHQLTLAKLDKTLNKSERKVLYTLRDLRNRNEKMTQVELAEYLGMSQSYVSRVLVKLKARTKKIMQQIVQ